MLSFGKKHYHWVIAAIMLLQLAVIGGAANNYSGLFILPITSELEISRSSFSFAFTLKYLFSFVAIFLSGPIFLRLGNHVAVVLGLILAAIGYVLLPLSKDLALLALGNVFLGFGEALCSAAAVSRIISVWFHRYKGLVWGFVSASTGVGGSAICLLLSQTITHGSWRAAYFLCSGMVFLIFLLVLFFVKARPEDMGLSPYGISSPVNLKKGTATQTLWQGYAMQELIKMPMFYLTLAGVFLSSFAIYLPYDIIIPHLQDQGLTANQAITQQSAMLIYLTVSKFAAGALSDWKGAKTVTIFCVAFGAVSLLLLTQADSAFLAGAAIVFYALALPVPSVLVPLLAVRLFGYRAQNIYHGIFMSMPLLGLLIASPIANTVFDTFNSYNPILLISMCLCIFSIFLYGIAYIISRKTEKAE